MYPEHLTQPMEKDLTDFGFTGLKTPEMVSNVLDQKQGTVLVVVNSVMWLCSRKLQAWSQNRLQSFQGS